MSTDRRFGIYSQGKIIENSSSRLPQKTHHDIDIHGFISHEPNFIRHFHDIVIISIGPAMYIYIYRINELLEKLKLVFVYIKWSPQQTVGINAASPNSQRHSALLTTRHPILHFESGAIRLWFRFLLIPAMRGLWYKFVHWIDRLNKFSFQLYP